ncbi:hypothetical protein LCGC14_3131130, partial [marine sediment metagenome]
KDNILRTHEHKMGRSVVRISPGLTREKEKGHYWLSALQHVSSLITAADRMLSMAATAAKFDAMPPMKRFTSSDTGGAGATGKTEWVAEGDIIDFPMSDQGQRLGDIEAMIQPRFGEKTQALVAFLLGRTERISGAVEAMEGLFSAETAWATNYAVEVATSRHSPLTRNVVAADMDDGAMILRAVEVSGEPLILKRPLS